MKQMTNDEFKDFIESFKKGKYENHRFYDRVTELSKSDEERKDPLIKHPIKMYALDWIVRASGKWIGDKRPKTTDALYINNDEYGNLSLHIIEFKFISYTGYKTKMKNLFSRVEDLHNNNNINCFDKTFYEDFEDITKRYKDPIAHSLQMKPFEAIFIVLPYLYDEYCDNNPKIEKKDIRDYLNNIDKYYWSFIGNYSKNQDHINQQVKKYNSACKRLEQGIFKKAAVKNKNYFPNILDNEILGNSYEYLKMFG